MATSEVEGDYQEETTTSEDSMSESAAIRQYGDGRLRTANAHDDVQDIVEQLQAQYQDWDTNFLAGNTHVTVDQDRSSYVRTPSLEQAIPVLQDIGLVVLCGPPGCGKSTTARALLRASRHDEFNIYTLRSLEHWDDHVGEGNKCAVLLDGVFGEVRVNSQQHDFWKQVLTTLMALLAKGSCRVVLTVYPHILQELRWTEKRQSPLKDDNAVVYMTDPLPDSVKEHMLNFHLNPLDLEADVQSDVVQSVLQKDDSGPVFPWCCEHMVDHWNVSEDHSAIFTAPAEAYTQLFRHMVMDQTHGEIFAAVLALSMKGVLHYLHRVHEAGPSLEELGFNRFSDDQLAVYAGLLHDSVLRDDGFSCRALYDAAGLVLGRFVRLPTLLRVCDLPFLIQYVHIRPVPGGGASDEVCVTVGSVPTCSTDRERCAIDCRSLAERVYKEIVVEGNLQAVCQHPSLQSPEFLQELENYCSANTSAMQRMLKAKDAVHRLPLPYWSALQPSPQFTRWCLSKAQAIKLKLKPKALVACSLFDYLSQNTESRLQTFLHESLLSKDFHYSQQVMELPLPEPNQRLTSDVQHHIETITNAISSQLRLRYLGNPSLNVRRDLVTFELTNDKLRIQIKDKRLWYLLFRLLTDRDRNESDSGGDTVLHLAASCRELSVVRLSFAAGADVRRQNKQGITPRQMFDKSRRLVDTGTGLSGLFEACCKGQAEIAILYIMLGANVNLTFESYWGRTLRTTFGFEFDVSATPLHYACMKGMTSTVGLLIGRQADVNASSAFDGKTPLHFAARCTSPRECARIVRLLVEAGANINAKDSYQNTPLHFAALDGLSHAVNGLISWGASLDDRNCVGFSPLLLAATERHSNTAQVLIRAGADVSYQNSWGDKLKVLGGQLANLMGQRSSLIS